MIEACSPRRVTCSATLALGIVVWLSSPLSACNVPVFRYALERWPADLFDVVVLHRGELSEAEAAAVEAIRKQSQAHRGTANIDVITCDVAQPLEGELAELWEQQSPSAQLPWVVLRSPGVRGRQTALWSGPLTDFHVEPVVDSPARQGLVQRLLAGDSVVWLVLAAKGDAQAAETNGLLTRELERLGDELPLPDGLGLPGSELYSFVPLTLRFSVLEVDAGDERERSFLAMLKTLAPPETEGPLVVPVFGRGRALDVLPARSVNESLIEDISVFLSGACSCQVKEQNPGFDLLLPVDWDRRLFDYNLLPPPTETAAVVPDGTSSLVAIPPGPPVSEASTSPVEPALAATNAIAPGPTTAPATRIRLTPYLAAALLAVGALVVLLSLRPSGGSSSTTKSDTPPKEPPV
jgi:hypothetical protein